MTYTVVNDLPERSAVDLLGSEYLLLTDPNYSYKVSIDTIESYITDVTQDNYQDLKNKVIDDISNYVHANAIHYVAYATEDLTKGTPVKLISSSDRRYVYVASAGTNDIAIGICEDGILEGELGEIMVSGVLDNFDTTAWSEGDLLYAINGEITNVQPTTNKIQFVGYVLNVDEAGKILVNGSDPYPDARSILYEDEAYIGASNVQDALDILANQIQDMDTDLITTSKIMIQNDEAVLPFTVKGEITNQIAFVYEIPGEEVITEYSVSLNANKRSLVFDSADNLNGLYCKVSYLAIV